MKTLFISMALLLAINTATTLKGKWTVVTAGSQVTGVEFLDNGTYNCYTNSRIVVSGAYNYNATDSSLFIEDYGCPNIIGSYKVVLFADNDSLQFIPVKDDCYERESSIRYSLLSRNKE